MPRLRGFLEKLWVDVMQEVPEFGEKCGPGENHVNWKRFTFNLPSPLV